MRNFKETIAVLYTALKAVGKRKLEIENASLKVQWD